MDMMVDDSTKHCGDGKTRSENKLGDIAQDSKIQPQPPVPDPLKQRVGSFGVSSKVEGSFASVKIL